MYMAMPKPLITRRAVAHAEEVGNLRVLKAGVGLLFLDARSGIFHDLHSLGDWRGGVTACGMYG